MSATNRIVLAGILVLSALAAAVETPGAPQAGGNSATVGGVVTDPSGAVIPGATVEMKNPVSKFQNSTTTDGNGHFSVANVPFNSYHVIVTAPGFANHVQDVDVRSVVPVNLTVTLDVQTSAEVVTVESGGDLVETDSTFHTDIDKKMLDELPLASQSSALSAAVTQTTPGVTADSDGLIHGLGDHAENSISLDGQPVTDQSSKVFSNQIPLDSVQSMEVITGAPPAEFGEKASVVINVTTRSGQGVKRPTGTVTASYGTFGSSNLGFSLSKGGDKWGNFISVNGLQTGRFLDPPEFTVIHAKGNQENVFDRVDYQINTADSLHVNLGFTRSWFQNPNSFDGQNATAWSGAVVDNGGLGPNGQPVGPSDQRSQIKTFNIAPSWTRVIDTATVFTLGGFVRHDQYNYYPSANPFSDLVPNLQSQTVGQDRTLTNAGARASVSYVKGIHNVKAGVTYQQTFLTENDQLGIVDPTFNAVCLNADGTPNTSPTILNPSQCGGSQNPGGSTNPGFLPVLLPYDLTRQGGLFHFHGHTDVKLLSMFVQDAITEGNWTFNLGVRGDLYNALSVAREAQPRLGVSYNVKRTNTVLRLSYARMLETPFNENLVLSSTGCNDPVLNPLLGCTASGVNPLSAGFRNEFHAGLQQAFGRYLVFSGEYIWKYTHNAYDFSVLGSTPITFPIAWHNSKIPGYAGRISVPNYHGLSASFVFSSVAARFFLPQLGGAGAAPSAPGGVFRIDHDQKFSQTTHLQYQPWQRGPWLGFNWRYDSGQVASAIPFATSADPTDPGFQIDLSQLSADQQFQAGLICNGVVATPTKALPASCAPSQFSSTLATVPAPGTENPDKNPPRIAPRHLFDLAVGHDDLFHGDRYKWGLQLTAVNLTDKKALYNFLSTFSGTHYVTPRTLTAQLTFNF